MKENTMVQALWVQAHSNWVFHKKMRESTMEDEGLAAIHMNK
jgi:hypothetical protein